MQWWAVYERFLPYKIQVTKRLLQLLTPYVYNRWPRNLSIILLSANRAWDWLSANRAWHSDYQPIGHETLLACDSWPPLLWQCKCSLNWFYSMRLPFDSLESPQTLNSDTCETYGIHIKGTLGSAQWVCILLCPLKFLACYQWFMWVQLESSFFLKFSLEALSKKVVSIYTPRSSASNYAAAVIPLPLHHMSICFWWIFGEQTRPYHQMLSIATRGNSNILNGPFWFYEWVEDAIRWTISIQHQYSNNIYYMIMFINIYIYTAKWDAGR